MKMQRQYRHSKYERYLELIGVLLVAESEDDLVMKNHSLGPLEA